MFVDTAQQCQELVYERKHNAKGVLEYFAWSDFTLYCYGCAQSEVEDTALQAEGHYDIYATFQAPFYDPVEHFTAAGLVDCYDTPGWHSEEYLTCTDYAQRRWCVDGAVAWPAHYGGARHRSPEEHCCVCGGGSHELPAPSPPPSDSPRPCLDLAVEVSASGQVSSPATLLSPGSLHRGTLHEAWVDPHNLSCADYEVKCAARHGTARGRAGAKAGFPD